VGKTLRDAVILWVKLLETPPSCRKSCWSYDKTYDIQSFVNMEIWRPSVEAVTLVWHVQPRVVIFRTFHSLPCVICWLLINVASQVPVSWQLPVAMIMVCQITTVCKVTYLLSKSLFAFKNTNAFMCWGDKEARRRLQTPTATENTRSDGADVAGIARYVRTRTASMSSQANRN